MTCSGSSGTGMPQPPARAAGRETLKSASPAADERQHLVAPGDGLDPDPAGLDGVSARPRRSGERRKNQFSSATVSGAAPCSGQRPSTSSRRGGELLAARRSTARRSGAGRSRRWRALRRHSRSTPGRCAAVAAGADEVVERQRQRRRAARRTGRRCGHEAGDVTPAARAAATFFSALSSVPVRKRTGCPRRRRCRASTSACTSSSAWPRCGAALT